MTRRRSLTDAGVAALKSRVARYVVPDPELRGHYVRVPPSGAKAFLTVTRDPSGKQIWTTIGPADVLSIEVARSKARDVLTRVRAGLPPFEAAPTKPATFEDIAGQWLARYVQAKGLRSEGEITRLLKAHVVPAWKDRPFLKIRRSDVAALLDHVEDEHSARQADAVLAIVRGVMNWFATRHDDYMPPLVRGMRRTDPKARQRARILDDDELRAVWEAAEGKGTFGAMVRIALLTAQRREKVANMRWTDISVDGDWTIPSEDREKGNAGILRLPAAAISIIQAQPRLGENPCVFAGRSNGAFNGFSKAKKALDARLPKGMPQWQFHDLRRTARSLMSRAGVGSDIAERIMGHVITGVEGVYDRHSYREEKADGLRRLARLLKTIVHPLDASNVVLIRDAQ
jgi:integrase